MFCAQCGTKQTAAAKFCSGCGNANAAPPSSGSGNAFATAIAVPAPKMDKAVPFAQVVQRQDSEEFVPTDPAPSPAGTRAVNNMLHNTHGNNQNPNGPKGYKYKCNFCSKSIIVKSYKGARIPDIRMCWIVPTCFLGFSWGTFQCRGCGTSNEAADGGDCSHVCTRCHDREKSHYQCVPGPGYMMYSFVEACGGAEPPPNIVVGAALSLVAAVVPCY
jgi:hypothetical protein